MVSATCRIEADKTHRIWYFFAMTALDTTEEALAVQLSVHRRLGPEARFRLAVEMSDAILELAETGMKHRHPGYTDTEVKAALLRELYGFKDVKP